MARSAVQLERLGDSPARGAPPHDASEKAGAAWRSERTRGAPHSVAAGVAGGAGARGARWAVKLEELVEQHGARGAPHGVDGQAGTAQWGKCTLGAPRSAAAGWLEGRARVWHAEQCSWRGWGSSAACGACRTVRMGRRDSVAEQAHAGRAAQRGCWGGWRMGARVARWAVQLEGLVRQRGARGVPHGADGQAGAAWRPVRWAAGVPGRHTRGSACRGRGRAELQRGHRQSTEERTGSNVRRARRGAGADGERRAAASSAQGLPAAAQALVARRVWRRRWRRRRRRHASAPQCTGAVAPAAAAHAAAQQRQGPPRGRDEQRGSGKQWHWE